MITPAQWLIKDRLIYAYAEGTATMQELRQHSDRVIALLNESSQPAHILLESSPDFRPERLDLRSGLDSLKFVHHQSLGWAVQVLQGNHSMRFVARLISRFARINYQIVESRDAAFNFLQMMDSNLDLSQMDKSILAPDENVSNS